MAALAGLALVPSAASAFPIDGPAAAARSATHAALRSELVHEALRYRGVPYAWAGSSPAGFDCSGFTSYVYGRFGTAMAHSSYAQYDAYRHVARRNLRAGDLVFFGGLGHVGIYIGRGRFVHSPHSGAVVTIDSMNGSWYRTSYVGAVRPPIHARSARLSAG